MSQPHRLPASSKLPAAPAAKIPFTSEAYAKLQTDLHRLQQERVEVMSRLKTAREMGDLSENGAYIYAKFELGRVNREITRIQHLLEGGEVVKIQPATGQVQFGSKVTVAVVPPTPAASPGPSSPTSREPLNQSSQHTSSESGQPGRALPGSTLGGHPRLAASQPQPADSTHLETQLPTITYTLVSMHESDLATHKLSIESPIGRALMGKKVGDTVKIVIPAGEVRYQILNIE